MWTHVTTEPQQKKTKPFDAKGDWRLMNCNIGTKDCKKFSTIMKTSSTKIAFILFLLSFLLGLTKCVKTIEHREMEIISVAARSHPPKSIVDAQFMLFGNHVPHARQSVPQNSIYDQFFPFPPETPCEEIDAFFFQCNFDSYSTSTNNQSFCNMSSIVNTTCSISEDLLSMYDQSCTGKREFSKFFRCLYCWQLPETEKRQINVPQSGIEDVTFMNHVCDIPIDCTAGREVISVKCRTAPSVICLGNRIFYKNKVCNYTTGKSWRLSLFLSFFFGMLGIDRMYLGYYALGVLKLSTVGGFVIWYLLDIFLIAFGVLKPMDSGLYG